MRHLCLLLCLTTIVPDIGAQAGTANGQIVYHDNTRPAGRLENGTLTIALRAGVGQWHPEGDAGPSRDIEAFGEVGQPLTIPSPLIRARTGTIVRLTIHNTLGAELQVHGLCDRPAVCAPLVVAPGATGDARFTLGAAGTFYYWATTTNQPLLVRDGADSQLGGAIIADDGAVDPRERVFVLGMLRKEHNVVGGETPVINGRSWPHNGRLHHAVGDTLRWRIINLTAAAHAMHLHGFYFNVESTSDGSREVRYTAATRAPVVTERLPVGGAFTMAWVPERAGNWLFHRPRTCGGTSR